MKKFIILISTITFFLVGNMAFAANNYQPRTQKQRPMRTIVEREYEEEYEEYEEEYVKPRQQYREPRQQYREPRQQYNYNNQQYKTKTKPKKQYNAPKYQTTSNQYINFEQKPNMYFGLQLGVANSCDVYVDNTDGVYRPFFYNISTQSGETAGLVLGGWFEEDADGRWEIELSGQSHKLKECKGTLRLSKFMCNMYLDIKNDSTITPFIFGGIGTSVGMLESSLTQSMGLIRDPIWIAFAYQIGVGAAISLTDDLLLDFSGKYFGSTEGTQKVKVIRGGQDYDYNIKLKHGGNTSFLAGIRFLF